MATDEHGLLHAKSGKTAAADGVLDVRRTCGAAAFGRQPELA